MLQEEINQKEWENTDNWSDSKSAVYFSKKDTRLWVPKKRPWQGKTINFGHPAGIRSLLGITIGPFIFILLISILIMSLLSGCNSQIEIPTQTDFQHPSGIYFQFPKDWSQLSKEEWEKQKMGTDQTLVTIMDKERMAGFSLIHVPLDRTIQQTTRLMGDELEARVVILLESINKAGPTKHKDYKLITKGASQFAGLPVGEINYQGQRPGKRMRWTRVLILAAEDIFDQILMIVFSTPLGLDEHFQQNFKEIEDSWTWKKK